MVFVLFSLAVKKLVLSQVSLQLGKYKGVIVPLHTFLFFVFSEFSALASLSPSPSCSLPLPLPLPLPFNFNWSEGSRELEDAVVEGGSKPDVKDEDADDPPVLDME